MHPQTPRFLAALATYSDTDNCELRYRSLTTTGVQVRVEEDTTYDSETQHLQAEAVHYLVFAGSGGLRARAWGSSDEVRRYYHLGGQRVAMRVSGAPASTPTRNGVYYIHTDHLGSTSLVTTGEDRVGLVAGSVWTRQLYEPYGAVRYAYNPYGPAPTDYGYTGQRATDLGLMDYRARWYIPAVGRFASADTITPGVGGQALNRYMYVGGNPLRYTDPTGHLSNDEIAQVLGFESAQQMYESDLWKAWTNGSTGDPYWLAVLAAIQSGDRLQASEYAGALLFQSVDGVMRVFAQGASANLWDWQGRGFYTIDRPGTSEREDAIFSDQVYASTAANYPLAFAYTTYRFPQYAYSEDPSGGISASFLDFQYVDRYMTVQWNATFIPLMTDWSYNSALDWAVDLVLLGGPIYATPQIGLWFTIAGIVKLGLDCSAVAGASLLDPVYYYRVVPPGTMINPFNILR